MTQQEFKDGRPFQVKEDHRIYVFEHEEEDIDLEGALDCDGSYFCNVSKIGPTHFYYYYFALGKRIGGKVAFADCITIHQHPY
jgi:hypothetical protein